MNDAAKTSASANSATAEALLSMSRETMIDETMPGLAAAQTTVRLPESEATLIDYEESLFERFAWLYIFCREKLFRDDTDRMIRALWSTGLPPAQTQLIELGCGPGFYSCEFAKRFPLITVTGLDQCDEQLKWARRKAESLGLSNCKFAQVDVLEPSRPDESFDVLIASRLFTVLPDRERAVSEMFRVLRSGGKCLIAEPRYAFWASIPLFAMWFLAGFSRLQSGYREPRTANVLPHAEFASLFRKEPWKRCRVWLDGRYQYALCEKD